MFTIEHINDLHDRLGSAKGLAQSGIEKWTVDTGRMTMTFYDRAGSEMLVEQIG